MSENVLVNGMGLSGTDPYNSGVQPYDDQGWPVPFTHSPTFAAPLILHVDSRVRNTVEYPNASSFAIAVPGKVTGVLSLELVDIQVPNVNATPPRDFYFFLCNGLKRSASDAYNHQTNPSLGQLYRAGGSDNQTVTTPTPPSNIPNTAFGKFVYDPSQAVQHWERRNFRMVNYYKPELGKVSLIEFALLDNAGTLYDLPSGANWTATFMVTCRVK